MNPPETDLSTGKVKPYLAASRELYFGIGTAGLAVLFGVFVIPSGVESPADVPHLIQTPTFLPYLTTGLIFIIGLLHAAESLKTRPGTPDAGESSRVAIHPRWKPRASVLCICFLAYLYLPGIIGFAATSVLTTAGLMLLAGERSPKVLIGGSIILPILVFLFFTRVAQVPLPLGIFE